MSFASTGHALSFWFFIDSGASTTDKILDDNSCSGGSGLYFTHDSTYYRGDVCGTGYTYRTGKPLDRWTFALGSFFDYHADIFINTS